MYGPGWHFHRGRKNSGAATVMNDGLRALEGPITYHITKTCPLLPTRRDGMRMAKGYAERDVEIYVAAFKWATNTEQAFMNVIEELKSNYEEVTALWGGYEKKLQEFRSMVKNDVTSLEAGARKTTEAVQRMKAAYGGVIEEMTSPQMEQAILNAERLAAAMTALAALKTQDVSFKVVGAAP